MADMIKITGIKGVLSKITNTKGKLNQSISRGLVKGGLFLQRESQKIVPVDTGNLRSSAFTRKLTWDHVKVGYTASYAAFVHENLNAVHGQAFNVKHADKIARNTERHAGKPTGTWSRRGQNQQAKFLETPARTKRTEILRIVANEASKI